MWRFILVGGLVLVPVATVTVVNLRSGGAGPKINWQYPTRLPPKEVQLEQPQRRDVVQTVTAPGTIELVEEADIASQVVGQVEEVKVRKGDQVNAGDLLVKLDNADAKARLESTDARIERLQAAIASAEADMEKAGRDLAGYEKLSERGFSTRSELEDGRTMVAKMEAALRMSRHELTEMTATRLSSLELLEHTEIRAPIAGTVIDLDVEVGEIVIAGTTNLPGTVLMTIGNLDRMRVRADVDESDVMLVRSQQPARIYLQADQRDPVPGKVELIAPKGLKTADVVSFETLISVDDRRPDLRPEMTATVEIEVKRVAQALTVPVQAVVQRRISDLPDSELFREWIRQQPKRPGERAADQGLKYLKVVFVLVDGIAHARPVETGVSDQEYIEIISGLRPEDRVVIGPFRELDELKDGQPVKEKAETATPKSSQP